MPAFRGGRSRSPAVTPSGPGRRRRALSAARGPLARRWPLRQLIDWHTHCYLPEHIGAEAQAALQAGVYGGEAWPEHRRRAWPTAGPRSSS